ncbi:hypothetical protein [Lacrimispora algidixylanolytica]|uniref:hypothetical protein n=1 Tax=Lacrimispora algidixylanolytica TaxID=94868 RepID=UPI0011C35BBF|nr:hypothetical protein [Lacrimispora algidixylanolytica]
MSQDTLVETYDTKYLDDSLEFLEPPVIMRDAILEILYLASYHLTFSHLVSIGKLLSNSIRCD